MKISESIKNQTLTVNEGNLPKVVKNEKNELNLTNFELNSSKNELNLLKNDLNLSNFEQQKLNEGEKKEEIKLNLDEIRAKLTEIKEKIEHFQRLYRRNPIDDLAEAILELQKEYSELEQHQSLQIASERKGKKYYSEALKLNFTYDADEHKAYFEDGVVYTEQEMRELHKDSQHPSNGIDLIHTMKKLFGRGRVMIMDGWVGV